MENVIEKLIIPEPCEGWLEENRGLNRSVPAPELNLFLERTILDENHFLFNLEHIHLARATIGFLWTNAPNSKRMKRIVGTAEMPIFRGSKWQKARQEQQLDEWFGMQPDFLITFDAENWAESSAGEKLYIFEHELTHCAQAVDMFGVPRFSKTTGKPVFSMRGHDWEGFTSQVRRYGVQAAGQDVIDLVEAAVAEPEIGAVQIKGICGTCAR